MMFAVSRNSLDTIGRFVMPVIHVALYVMTLLTCVPLNKWYIFSDLPTLVGTGPE